MPTYDLGDGVNLRYLARDRDQNPVAATVALAITRPDGTVDAVATVASATVGQYDSATYVPVAVGQYTYRWTVSGAVTDVANGAFLVSSSGPATYATLTAVKSQLGKITVDDRDEMIQSAILSASRMIDSETGRWPGAYAPAPVATPRTFSTLGRVWGVGALQYAVRVDDISSEAGLVVEGGVAASGVWSALTAYRAGPDNAISIGQPVSYLTMASSSFAGIDSVRVTARWGWPSTPSEIELATRLLAARLYRRKDSPQGVIATPEFGGIRVSRFDPDVRALLSPFMIPGFA